MSNDLLKFAQWLDSFETRNPERKFASVEEALGFYQAYESRTVGNYSEIEKFVASIPEGANGKQAPHDGSNELSVEIMARAMKEEGGEYFYACFAPGPDGVSLMDIGVKNGRRLVEVLASLSLDQNQGAKVAQFTNFVSRILIIATNHIAKERARRAQNN